MMQYVAGFLFDEFREQVVLVHKNRPQWQAGMWNGVGGKIERKTANHTCYDISCDVGGFDPCQCPYETPVEAMQREFKEEAGLRLESWREFAVLTEPAKYQVCFLCAFEPYYMFEGITTMTDEEVQAFPIESVLLGHVEVIPNLRWLIPMALEQNRLIYHIQV
jgi:8-oxo-dGTP diphosphatase